MDELTDEVASTHLDRREMLRRGAFVLGATVVWTTPVVQTLGARAAAAGTNDPSEGGLCPPGAGAPSNLVFRYDGSTAAMVEINRPKGPAPGTWCVANLLGGQTFQVPGKANPEMELTVASGDSSRSVRVHTSCSQPLAIGDRFGALVLVGGLNHEGGKIGTTNPDVVAVAGACTFVNSDEAEEDDDPEAEPEDIEGEEERAEDSEHERTDEPERAEDSEHERTDEPERDEPEPERSTREELEPERSEPELEADPEEVRPEAQEPVVDSSEQGSGIGSEEAPSEEPPAEAQEPVVDSSEQGSEIGSKEAPSEEPPAEAPSEESVTAEG